MTRNTYVLIATLGSAALLLGAFGFQHIGRLRPVQNVVSLGSGWPHCRRRFVISGGFVLFRRAACI